MILSKIWTKRCPINFRKNAQQPNHSKTQGKKNQQVTTETSLARGISHEYPLMTADQLVISKQNTTSV